MINHVDQVENFIERGMSWLAHKAKWTQSISVALTVMGSLGAYKASKSLVRHVMLAKQHYFPTLPGSFGPYLPYISVIKKTSDVCFWRVFGIQAGLSLARLGVMGFKISSKVIELRQKGLLSREALIHSAEEQVKSAKRDLTVAFESYDTIKTLQEDLNQRARNPVIGLFTKSIKQEQEEINQKSKSFMKSFEENRMLSLSKLKEASEYMNFLAAFSSVLSTEQEEQRRVMRSEILHLIEKVGMLQSVYTESFLTDFSPLPQPLADICNAFHIGNNNVYDQLAAMGLQNPDFLRIAGTIEREEITLRLAGKNIFSFFDLEQALEKSGLQIDDNANLALGVQDILSGAAERRLAAGRAPLVRPNYYNNIKASIFKAAYKADQVGSLIFAKAFKIASLYMAVKLPMPWKFALLGASLGYVGWGEWTPLGRNSPSDFQKSGWLLRANWISSACNPFWHLATASGEITKKGINQAPRILLEKFWR